ncbi:MAG: acyltransferase [Actinobacteria bacterium]|nr:acyltransferase [Actinomycetota bacterium]
MEITITDIQNQTTLFLIILGIILLFTMRKRVSPAFDMAVTNEIKGIGLLMVLFAHIGYFLISDHNFLFPISVGGGIGVNLFFFLSGYGLSVSALKNRLSILDFYKKRVVKLFIPLWIILSVFLLMDFFILNRGYGFTEIWHAYLGYYPAANLRWNINSPLWFITPIIFYYLIFPLIFNKKFLTLTGLLMMVVSYFLLFNESVITFLVSNDIFKSDVLKLYRTHYIAFPAGMILADLAFNKPAVAKIWSSTSAFLERQQIIKQILALTTLIAAAFVSWHTAVYSGVFKGDIVEQNYSLATCTALIYLFVFNKVRFGVFSIIGIYSYEMYLIHWPLLSRYEIFYRFLPPALATLAYIVYFLLLGFLLNKITNFISSKVLRIV